MYAEPVSISAGQHFSNQRADLLTSADCRRSIFLQPAVDDQTAALNRRWPVRRYGTRGRRTRATWSRTFLRGSTSVLARRSRSRSRPPHPPSRTGSLPTDRNDHSERYDPPRPLPGAAARTWMGVPPLQTARCPPYTLGRTARTRRIPYSFGAVDVKGSRASHATCTATNWRASRS